MSRRYNVAVAGATGAVGAEFLQLLEERADSFPLGELTLLASSRSVGKSIQFRGRELPIRELTADSFRGVDIAFFSAGGSPSRQFAPAAIEAGAVVIDNSSAFRMDPQVPLVVPEVNGDDALHHHGIIANPNCAAILLLMAVAPLHRLSPIRRIVVSTYQAASGAGAAAMRELEAQTRAYLGGEPIAKEVFPHQIAFNLFSHNTAIDATGYNGEELKVVEESRKIMHLPDLAIAVTCVRVPILRAHSESVNIEFATERPTVAAARAALDAFPGVRVVDDRAGNTFPMPLDASGRDDVLVGRLREDLSHPRAMEIFLAGDQIRKGAALNGIQIAEYLIEHGGVRPTIGTRAPSAEAVAA